jgi:hypothetical protein
MPTKRLPPGTRAPVSGIYEQIGPRGGRTGEEADSTRGKLSVLPHVILIPVASSAMLPADVFPVSFRSDCTLQSIRSA